MASRKTFARYSVSPAALIAATCFAGAAAAQPSAEGTTLDEIVVTAQKREQSLQDVPISITAVTEETLQANRITNVGDLASVSPGLTARPTIGGSGVPSFTMRGVTSYGVVPGSDKSVSLYIDGVYIGSTNASIFDLPDIERIEVLRGPQGTLFGRNATAGAVSVITRNPSGVFGLRQEATVGNYDHWRSRTRLDLPAWGPISASLNYVHDQRRGDIRNLGAGQRWDRQTGSPRSRQGIQISPKYLGDKDADIFFSAVRFEPNDWFSATWKFDYSEDHFTPEGNAPVAIDFRFPGVGGLLAAAVASTPNPVVFAPDAKRPKAVNNSWNTDSYQRVWGHSITTDLQVNDSITVRNILAYRETFNFANSDISGLGGLVLTPQMLLPFAQVALGPDIAAGRIPPAAIPGAIQAFVQGLTPLLGSPFVAIGSQNQSESRQWSDEIQVNYTSDLVTLTAGALYFDLSTQTGAPPGLPGTLSFTPVFNGIMPAGAATSYNQAHSAAAYAQAEVHVTPQIDIIGGYRITRDKKSGIFYGRVASALTGAREVTTTFTYEKTKPTYLVGVNWRPTDDILVYGKYATGFVSGGGIGGIFFDPETARSWEVGVKADLLDRRLRTNLTAWQVDYKNLQSAQSGQNVGRPDLSTAVITQGDAEAKGFEFEATAVPIRGLTLNAGVGYSDLELGRVNPILTRGLPYEATGQPNWTTVLSAQYDTQPIWDEAFLSMRLDANWHDRYRVIADPALTARVPAFEPIEFIPSVWILNGRIALKDIELPVGAGEIAIWGRNLTDNDDALFAFGASDIFYATSFQKARTFGVDLVFTY